MTNASKYAIYVLVISLADPPTHATDLVENQASHKYGSLFIPEVSCRSQAPTHSASSYHGRFENHKNTTHPAAEAIETDQDISCDHTALYRYTHRIYKQILTNKVLNNPRQRRFFKPNVGAYVDSKSVFEVVGNQGRTLYKRLQI